MDEATPRVPQAESISLPSVSAGGVATGFDSTAATML